MARNQLCIHVAIRWGDNILMNFEKKPIENITGHGGSTKIMRSTTANAMALLMDSFRPMVDGDAATDQNYT